MNRQISRKLVAISIVALALTSAILSNVSVLAQDTSTSTATTANDASAASQSYFSQARKFFDTGMEAHQQAKTVSSLLPNEDPSTVRMLRDSISRATGWFQSI